MVLILTLKYAMIILNNLVNTDQWNKNITLFYKNNFKRTIRFAGTINAEINKRTFYPSLENRNVL